MKQVLAIMVALIIVSGGAYFLLKKDSSTTFVKDNMESVMEDINMNQEDLSMMDEGDKMIDESSMMEEVEEVSIEAGEFFFNPKNITLTAGEKVKLTLKNVGNGNHDWRIEGTEIKTKVIKSGQSDIIKFTAPAAGTYVLYCSVPEHRERGMVGELTVN